MAHEKTTYPADFAKSCSNCKFCDTITNPVQATAMMICRVKPPGSQGQCIGLDPGSKTPQWVYTTLWPVVSTSDWCGEHRARLSS